MKPPGWFIAGLSLASLGGPLFADPVDAGRYRLSVLAGTPGLYGSVDGDLASALIDPASDAIAVDRWGNIYLAETGAHTVRKITPDGLVTTLAGIAGETGSQDGTGSEARFNQPQGLAVDGAGNVYVADAGNSLIRKISPEGVVTTLASAVGKVAVDDAGNVYVIETFPELAIRRIDGEGTLVALRIPNLTDDPTDYWPGQVRVDPAGNIYILSAVGWDYTDVVKLTPNGEGDYEVNRIPPPFEWPSPRWWETRWAGGMALDAAGNLYLKYDLGPLAKYATDGTIEIHEVAGDASRYWGDFGADNAGTLFVLPNRTPLRNEWDGTIFVSVFEQ